MKDESENARRLPVKNRIKIVFIVALVVLVLFGTAAGGFLAYLSPPKDDIFVFDYPSAYFCETEENRIDFQTDGNCAAYASAYVLRHLGENASGEESALEIGRIFGFVSANKIVDFFEKHGFRAKACRGSVETLKQRLTEGCPVIVFTRISGDTHYAVVVGYDERHIYLADSLAENANASDARYNRVLTTEEFESVWKTKTLLPDNVYIKF